jgi:hypothetical protein
MNCSTFSFLPCRVFWGNELPACRAVLPPTIRRVPHTLCRLQEENPYSPSSDIWGNRRYDVRSSAGREPRPNCSTPLRPPPREKSSQLRPASSADYPLENPPYGSCPYWKPPRQRIKLVCERGRQGNEIPKPAAFSADSAPLNTAVAIAPSATPAMLARGPLGRGLSDHLSCCYFFSCHPFFLSFPRFEVLPRFALNTTSVSYH